MHFRDMPLQRIRPSKSITANCTRVPLRSTLASSVLMTMLVCLAGKLLATFLALELALLVT